MLDWLKLDWPKLNWPKTAAMAVALLSATAAGADERRARIVESSLKDLSATNDAAISRHRLTAERELDAMGDARVALRPESISPADNGVRRDVQSSLHRLRRETASQQTEDGRAARVQESLDRAARAER